MYNEQCIYWGKKKQNMHLTAIDKKCTSFTILKYVLSCRKIKNAPPLIMLQSFDRLKYFNNNKKMNNNEKYKLKISFCFS